MTRPRASTVDSDVSMEASPRKKQSTQKQQEEDEFDSSDQNEDGEFTVEAILKAERDKTPNKGWSYLIKWDGYNEKTWEPEDNVVSTELLEAFWAGRKEQKAVKVKGTKVGPPLSASAKKKAAALIKEKSVAYSPAPSASKKRASGRKSVVEDEDEEDLAPVTLSSTKKRKAAEGDGYEREPVEKEESIEFEDEDEEVAASVAKKTKVAVVSQPKKDAVKPAVQDVSDSEGEGKGAPASEKEKLAVKAFTKKAATSSLKANAPAASASKANEAKAAANGKNPKLAAPASEPDEEELNEQDVADSLSADPKYNTLTTWEEVVEKVETVERAAEGEGLVVFLRVKGEATKKRCSNNEAKNMLPLKLIAFYETHLRWKSRPKTAK